MISEIIFVIVIFLNFLLSFFVFSQNPKSYNNRFFAILSLFGGLWALTNYMTGIIPTPFWLESAYAFGALVLATGLLWTLQITDKNLNIKTISLIIIVAIIFFIGSYIPGFIA